MSIFCRTLVRLACLLAITVGPAAVAAVDADLLSGLKARSIGPAGMSGRIAAIDAVIANPNIIYVGAATGGLWKSTNGGLNWTPVFDDQRVSSIGAVAIYQANPDIVWAGTGEGNPRNSSSVGAGIYKSMDGGKTWALMGLEKTERIHRILLDPTNPDVAYVGAMGRAWGENPERGVFKTTDGGKSWKKILYVDPRTGIGDMVMDPSNPGKIIAAMWDFRRWPWAFRSGGPGSGLYLTYNGGETWKRLSTVEGLPKGDLGRIGVAFSASHPNVVYALVEAKKSALVRSDDGGETWKTVSDAANVAMRPFYFNDIRVDPEYPDRLYRMTQAIHVSDDGGKNFTVLAPFRWVHPDHHALWVSPADPRILIDGNDGGLAISHDRGRTWRFVRNLPLAQFYHIAVDNDLPYHVYGGMQDNGSWRGPAEVWENGGIRNLHWAEINFGDGFNAIPDPEDSMQGYAMSQGGSLVRWNMRTGVRKSIRPAPPVPGLKLRFNWNAALAIDPFDAATVYYGSQFVHKSTNRGDSWTVISADLTTNDPAHQKQAESGGVTRDVTAAENFTTIVAIAPSPLEKGVIWAGTDDGRVQITRDGGGTWQSLEKRARKVPKGTWVPHIEASPFDPGTAFVVFDNHRRSDWKTYVYRVTDYGRKWTSIAGPEIDGYALTIVQDFKDPNLLFLGTEFGLYVSLDGGKGWRKWTQGLPTVPVKALAIQKRESDLVIGTHGRAAYIIDDYSALRGLDDKALGQRLALLPVADAQSHMVRQTGASRFPGSGEFRGTNAPYGALITWIMSGDDLPLADAKRERARLLAKAGDGPGDDSPEKPQDKDKDKVTIEIRTQDGDLVRTMKVEPRQGINRAVWNLRHDAARRFRDAPPAGGFGPRGGVSVPAGSYRISLEYGDATATGTVTVRADPRLAISPEDRAAKYRAALHLKALRDLAADTGNRIIDIRADIERVEKRAGDIVARARKEGQTRPKDDPLAAVGKESRALLKRLGEIENSLRTTPRTRGVIDRTSYAMGKIGFAARMLNSSREKPTAAQLAYVAEAEASLKTAMEQLNVFAGERLTAFRTMAEDAGLGLLASGTPLVMPAE